MAKPTGTKTAGTKPADAEPADAEPADTDPIVVGMDGSTPADHAVVWAADEAVLRGRPLRLVHSVEFWPMKDSMYAPPQRVDEITAAGRVVLADTEKKVRVRHPGLEVTSLLTADPPARVLREESARGFETVVGNRGRGGFASLLLGSTGRSLAEHASGPVVIVRGEAEPGRNELFLGVDLDDDRDETLRYAFETAELRGARLWVMHVWETFGPVEPGFATDELEIKARLSERLDSVLVPWRRAYPDLEVVPSVEIGHPVATLARASRAADLMILGSQGMLIPGVQHLGSVTHGLIHHAVCPVVVVRPR